MELNLLKWDFLHSGNRFEGYQHRIELQNGVGDK